jgi:hypothetical protein
MTKRGLFKVTPVSTKSVGVTPTRPDPDSLRGSDVLREQVRAGLAKVRAHGKSV